MTANKYFTIYCSKALLARLFVLLPGLFLLSSCGNDNEEKTATKNPDSATVYYPINNYIRQQIKDVDTTPYFLYRLSALNKKEDSAVVSRSKFDAQIKQFLLPELEDKAFRNDFIESVFDDESTNSITLTYTPKSKANIVQNASVLLDKESQQVKWIFINTLANSGDSTVIQRIGWKGEESCYFNQIINHTSKPETQRRLSFVWNEKKEE